MPQIFHALALHLHQPPDNLQLLIDTNPKEAEQIIHCYDRITRFAHKYTNIAHFHIAFSGLLLQQLQQPNIIEQYKPYIDIPAMLESYRLAKNIELLGVGMYHPIFPLIAPEDWEIQLQQERDLMLELFGRAPRGFLPPEMAFSMQMIPALVKAGYEYVLIDASCVRPEHERVDIFQPYLAHYDNVSITVIPISRDISHAQQTGLDPVWFANEVRHQVSHSIRPEAPRLLSTWSNGENKRWFRQEEEGFFGRFVAPYAEHAENGEYPVLPISISEYLKQHPADIPAYIETGAWSSGSTSGYGLADWGGSDAQRSAIANMRDVRQRYEKLAQLTISDTDKTKLEQIQQLILTSQSSCFLFWGDAWIQKLSDFLQSIERQLSALETIYLKPTAKPKPQPVVTPQPLVLPKKPAKSTTSSHQPVRPTQQTEPDAVEEEPPAKPINKPIRPTDAKPVIKTEAQATPQPVARPTIDKTSAAEADNKAQTTTRKTKPAARSTTKPKSTTSRAKTTRTKSTATKKTDPKADATQTPAADSTANTQTRRKTTTRKTTKKTS
ncbi:hypothetical protein [Candidatus Albibeggiatoa sp. nov. NOAA]|uniref:hypothetical protein n=1 Tax=Candidatus Albibeggiatoa sp. nov. NOAA TaxID=3162724 RepID=UPI0032F98969|nr:hypothetical protein [Thiotrichaceae bacterium]